MSTRRPRVHADAKGRHAQRPTMATRHRVHIKLAVLTITAALAASGCSSGYKALGTHTARVVINGTEIEDRPPIWCEQVQWVWFVDTLQPTPGFSAQVRTGGTADALLVRIDKLGGFTGSSWNATGTAVDVGVDARVANGTFTIAGTALGFFHDDPTETTTANFEIRADC
ncbi:MAG: lipoprotein LpqH [Mycobacterium sp.]